MTVAPDTWSGITLAVLGIASVIGSGAWALMQVCMRLDRMERSLAILLEAHNALEKREGR